jgi:hypothetical protein
MAASENYLALRDLYGTLSGVPDTDVSSKKAALDGIAKLLNKDLPAAAVGENYVREDFYLFLGKFAPTDYLDEFAEHGEDVLLWLGKAQLTDLPRSQSMTGLAHALEKRNIGLVDYFLENLSKKTLCEQASISGHLNLLMNLFKFGTEAQIRRFLERTSMSLQDVFDLQESDASFNTLLVLAMKNNDAGVLRYVLSGLDRVYLRNRLADVLLAFSSQIYDAFCNLSQIKIFFDHIGFNNTAEIERLLTHSLDRRWERLSVDVRFFFLSKLNADQPRQAAIVRRLPDKFIMKALLRGMLSQLLYFKFDRDRIQRLFTLNQNTLKNEDLSFDNSRQTLLMAAVEDGYHDLLDYALEALTREQLQEHLDQRDHLQIPFIDYLARYGTVQQVKRYAEKTHGQSYTDLEVARFLGSSSALTCALSGHNGKMVDFLLASLTEKELKSLDDTCNRNLTQCFYKHATPAQFTAYLTKTDFALDVVCGPSYRYENKLTGLMIALRQMRGAYSEDGSEAEKSVIADIEKKREELVTYLLESLSPNQLIDEARAMYTIRDLCEYDDISNLAYDTPCFGLIYFLYRYGTLNHVNIFFQRTELKVNEPWLLLLKDILGDDVQYPEGVVVMMPVVFWVLSKLSPDDLGRFINSIAGDCDSQFLINLYRFSPLEALRSLLASVQGVVSQQQLDMPFCTGGYEEYLDEALRNKDEARVNFFIDALERAGETVRFIGGKFLLISCLEHASPTTLIRLYTLFHPPITYHLDQFSAASRSKNDGFIEHALSQYKRVEKIPAKILSDALAALCSFCSVEQLNSLMRKYNLPVSYASNPSNLKMAAANGNTALTNYLVDNAPLAPSMDVIDPLATGGYTEACKRYIARLTPTRQPLASPDNFLKGIFPPDELNRLLLDVARNGHMPMLAYLLKGAPAKDVASFYRSIDLKTLNPNIIYVILSNTIRKFEDFHLPFKVLIAFSEPITVDQIVQLFDAHDRFYRYVITRINELKGKLIQACGNKLTAGFSIQKQLEWYNNEIVIAIRLDERSDVSIGLAERAYLEKLSYCDDRLPFPERVSEFKKDISRWPNAVPGNLAREKLLNLALYHDEKGERKALSPQGISADDAIIAFEFLGWDAGDPSTILEGPAFFCYCALTNEPTLEQSDALTQQSWRTTRLPAKIFEKLEQHYQSSEDDSIKAYLEIQTALQKKRGAPGLGEDNDQSSEPPSQRARSSSPFFLPDSTSRDVVAIVQPAHP